MTTRTTQINLHNICYYIGRRYEDYKVEVQDIKITSISIQDNYMIVDIEWWYPSQDKKGNPIKVLKQFAYKENLIENYSTFNEYGTF